jgi:agmatine deiminase
VAEPATQTSISRLVPDWETDRVTLVLPTAEMATYNRHLAALELFYADFCRDLSRHETVTCVVPDAPSVEKMVRLSGLAPESFVLDTIPDIWIRDFAPIPSASGGIKFRYDPLYTSRRLNREVDESFRDYLRRHDVRFQTSEICLEGGNLVHNGAGVAVATEKLFVRNRPASRDRVVNDLRQALGLERLVLVPAEPEDRTGHVDGMLRFVDERTLVVNDYSSLEGGARFRRRLERVLERELAGFERIELPYHACSEKLDGWYDARGNYANFFLTRRRLYLPAYGIPEDEDARELFETLFPGRVSPVDASLVARYGGSLNCITWNHR